MLRLPDELLLEIYKAGGLETLSGGLSQTCHRLRQLSLEDSLWENELKPIFETQCLSTKQIATIPNLRQWYFKQLAISNDVIHSLNTMVEDAQDGNEDPRVTETWIFHILRNRLSILSALEMVKNRPESLAHYHWAHWLSQVVIHLEGLYLLLDLTCKDDWGNGYVDVPIDHVLALLMLRTGRFPSEIRDALENPPTISGQSITNQAESLAQYVEGLVSQFIAGTPASVQSASSTRRHVRTGSSTSDFFSVLTRSTIFVAIARKLGWDVKLLAFPQATYCCIESSVDPNSPAAFFVDFSHQGKLRSLEDIRERLIYTNTLPEDVRYGISLYDILATTYVWHALRTTTRHSVLELVDYAARNIKMTPLRKQPHLYENIVRRIIDRNIAEVDAPVPRSRANSVSSTTTDMERFRRTRRIRKGDVCQLEIEQTADENPLPQACVVVDVPDDANDSSMSYLVVVGHELKRVSREALRPGYNGKCTHESGLLVPDIGADVLLLGQYFIRYNPAQQSFV